MPTRHPKLTPTHRPTLTASRGGPPATRVSAERSAVAGPSDPRGPLPDALSERVADTMFALSTPSRLQILACLRAAPRTVSEIVAAVGMEQSAVSHQLRVLRDHSVVSMRRLGRRRQYALRDEHIGAIIDNALEHVRVLDLRDDDAGATQSTAS